MLNIIYLHGLESSPRPDKMAVLEALGDTLFAPQLDYFGNVSLFVEILEQSQNRAINFVVGSSAGGLMGYWLAKHLQCNSLLFNPALNYLGQRPDIFPPEGSLLNQFFHQKLILGGKDAVINYHKTLKYLQESEASQNYSYEILPNLAHSIDLETFTWACEKYIK